MGHHVGAKKKALDIFTGSGSVADALRKEGYEVFTLDIDPQSKANFTIDVLEWQVEKLFKPGFFHLVAASPPCTEYSSCMTRRPREMEKADLLVQRTIDIITYLKPPMWWIENPRHGRLSSRDVVAGLPFVDIDFCRFSTWGYQKPTRFWCSQNIASRGNVVCDGKCANLEPSPHGGLRHKFAIANRYRQGPPNRHKQVIQIPENVVHYLTGFSALPKIISDALQSEWTTVGPPTKGVATQKVCSAREVRVRPWHHLSRRPFRVGKLEHRGGALQLMVEVEISVCGHHKKIQALIDTGAQANLIRGNIFPDAVWKRARNPLALMAANGDVLSGGQREIEASITFHVEPESEIGRRDSTPTWSTMARFYDGEISCDAILGYGWLAQQKLDVLPWRNALQLHHPPRWILVSKATFQPFENNLDSENGEIDVSISPRENNKKKSVWSKQEWQGLSEEEILDRAVQINRVRTLQLELAEEVNQETGDLVTELLTDEETLWEAAKLLQASKPTTDSENYGENSDNGSVGGGKKCAKIRGYTITEDPIDTPLAKELREKLIADYKDSVFREKVWPKPPIRGPHGAAKLYLKPGAKPVCGRTFGLSGERLEALRALEKEWKEDGKIEPGVGPWRATPFPIKKKNGNWRGVCDYSRTNQEIQDDSYPLPRIPDILVQQGGCDIFSTMDIRDAFHQVYLDEASRPITCIQLPGGLFQWAVVPQGVKTGPPLLQRDVDCTLDPVQRIAKAYFDDINSGTRKIPKDMSEEQLLLAHNEDLRKVLDRLAEHKWVIDPKKCVFFARRVEFCGHVLGQGTVRPSPGKMAAVQLWEPPTTVTALRAFLGLCNYYSGYIHMYADLAAPLQEKLKLPKEQTKAGSKAKVTWTPAELEAFKKLKCALAENLELQHLDTSKPFILRTDASDFAIGAVLEQVTENTGPLTLSDLRNLKPGSTRPVAFMSRKLTNGQSTRWDTREKETYAVVSALEKWASYIGYSPVTILTDHKSLESWWKENIDLATGPSAPRRLRWHSKLSLFRLDVVYVPGSSNGVPDALSRWAYPASEAYKERSKHGTLEDAQEMENIIRAEHELERSFEEHGDPTEIRFLQIRMLPSTVASAMVAGVTTRRGATTNGENLDPEPQVSPSQRRRPQVSPPTSVPTLQDPPDPPPPPSEPVLPEIALQTPPNAAPLFDPGVQQMDAEEPRPPLGNESVLDMDWGLEYENCPKWSDAWKRVNIAQQASGSDAAWPTGFQLEKKRLIFDGRWCVPEGLTAKVLRAQHGETGHAGGERLLKEALRFFNFADERKALRISKETQRQCEICQACEHPHQPLKLRIEPHPIPPYIMTSVAIDIFRMPEIEHDGKMYNCFACCVDRLSGWMVTTPHHLRGLKASDVAKAMYQAWWSPHGVPSVLVSDRGAHFAGAWWRAMCAHHGIRHGYAIAYHHASNGRAEVAGSQIQKILRKLHASEAVSWYEGLQRAVRMIHDLPGESGLSPYEILYGRHRPYSGVPYQPPTKMEDAVAFFKRQEDTDQKIGAALRELHEKRAEQVNKNRSELSVLDVGGKVWWLRPRGQTGDKLETYWVGPCRILGRKSAHTYTIETREGHSVDAHRCQLKEHHEDIYHHQPLALFHFKQAVSDVEVGIQEWEVEAITEHQIENGELKFLVKWANHEQTTWEPIGHFFHRYAKEFVRYCSDKGINPDIVGYLHKHPISDDEEAAEIRLVVARMYDTQFSTQLEWIDPPEDFFVETDLEGGQEGQGDSGEEVEKQLLQDGQRQPTHDKSVSTSDDLSIHDPSDPSLLTPLPPHSTETTPITPRLTKKSKLSSYFKGIMHRKGSNVVS